MKKLSTVQLLLLSIAISVAMTEFIVCGMGFLLKGEVPHDYLLTGLVASLFVSGFVASFLTFFITSLRESDAALRLQSRITSEAAEGVALVRPTDGEIIFTNRHFDEMFGYGPDELIGQHVSVVNAPTHASQEETANQIIQSLKKDGAWNGELLNRKKDGTTFWTSTHVSAFSDKEYGSLWVAYQSDITELKVAELEREQYFRLFNTAPDLMCIADSLGCFKKVNPAFVETFGYAESELLSKPLIDFILPNDRQSTRDEIARQLQSGFSYNLENRYICKDGSVRHLSWRTYYDKEKNTTYATATDITERKQAEEVLHRSEERWKFALEGAGDGVWDVNLETQETIYSKHYQEMLGYTEGEFKGTHSEWLDHIHPEDKPYVTEAVKAYLDGKSEIYTTEFRLRCKDASYKWIYERGMVVSRTADGKPLRMVGTHTDITERKLSEELLKKNEERLNLAQSAGGIGIWDWDVEHDQVSLSPLYYRLLGLFEGMPYGYEDFLAMVYPEDRARVDTKIKNSLSGSGAQQDYEIECRLIRAEDGALRWFALQGQFFFYEGNRPVRALGIITDITDRKLSEQEQKLAALVYHNCSEAITVTDADNHIVAINPAFTKLTGYTEDEVLGKNLKILDSDRQDAEFYRAMWDALNTTGHWQGETWNRRKNGDEYAEWLSINTIYNEDGSVHRRVALFTDITERKNAEAKVWVQANFDPLTQLPNRRLFADRLEQEIKKAQRDKYRTALLFIDLDRFKDINDTLGHDIGDLLLIEAASRVKHCVRGSDTVARLGGDEFTVILSELDDALDAVRIAQNIINRLSEPFRLNGQEAFVSASIGIAFYPDDAVTVIDLTKQADQAMYAAKNDGRGCFRFFTKTMQEAAELRMRLARDLRHALKLHQFEVYYQPIVDLDTGHIHKSEALLRWKHPEHGFISPAVFIPIAEETGTINDIGDWVFMQVVQQAKRWQSGHHRDFQISVNKSPVQFMQDDRVHNNWIEQLREMELPGSGIVIEITESLLMSTDAHVTDKLLMFRDAGIQVAIDDFGTGYSSLAYIKKFYRRLKTPHHFCRINLLMLRSARSVSGRSRYSAPS